MKKLRNITLITTLVITFFSNVNTVGAVAYITPTVKGVISSSQYSPDTTYPEWSTISGNYLYYSGNWGNTFTIADISNPQNPVNLSILRDGDTGATIKSPKGVSISGDYAYLVNWNNATNDESIEILNISDKSHPYHVSNFIYATGTGDNTYAPYVKDDYIYVPGGTLNKFYIIDARNKSTPVLASTLSSGTAKLTSAYNVVISGNYAFVTSYSGYLEVLDITNKTAPTHVTYLANGTGGALLNGASAMRISGNYLYISSFSSSALEIINISNPTVPVHAGSIVDGAGGAKIKGYELDINGNYAYLSSYDKSAIEIVDISNPANPTHAGVVNDGDNGAALNRPRAINYANNTVYVSVSGSNRMEVIDVTNRTAPVHVNSIDSLVYLGGARFVKIHNGFAYVTSNVTNSMQIIDITNKSNPVRRGSLVLRANGAQLYSPLGMDFYGNYAYITQTGANMGGGGTHATWGGLEIADISNPDNPVHVNYIGGPTSIFAGSATGGVQNIKIVGNYAYLTLKNANALKVMDIGSNPTNPSLVATLVNGTGGVSLSAPMGIDIVGNYAYITTSNALEIVNISNPLNPTHVGSLTTGTGGALLTTANYINVVGNYAYIASSGSNALEIVNISNPASPTHAGSLTNGTGGALLASAYGLAVADNRAYIGSYTSNALEIVNVANLASPTHLYSIADGSQGAKLVSARGVDLDGDYAYVVAYNGSSNAMNIVQIKDSVAPTLSETTPIPSHTKNQTPSYTFTTNEAGTITYGGSCSSSTTSATVGSNTITFNILVEGIYSNCTVQVVDSSTNSSNVIHLSSFIVDITKPIILINGSNPMSVSFGSSYSEPGATCTDNIDVTCNVVITGGASINTNALGSYYVYYNTTDSTGNNATQITRTVNVIDTDIPIITLLGTSTVIVAQNSSYVDAGATASDNVDGNITSHIIVTGSVDTSTLGNYTLYYNVSDNSGLPAIQVSRTVTITDQTAPVISETTPIPSHTKNQTPSYTFTTNEAGTITYGGSCSSSTTSATVGSNTITFNTLSEGTYSNCTISVTDASSNTSSLLSVSSFTVDVTLPVIKLVGINPINIYVGQEYIDPGVTALDDVDGDISSNIVSTANNINMNIAGTYIVTYNVSDSSLNQALEVTRTVYVMNRPSSGSTLAFRINFLAQQQALLDSQKEQVVVPVSPIITKILNITKVLKPSINKDDDVKIIQTYLSTVLKLKIKPDGVFGKQTKLAIMKFQKDHNLTPDGIVGQKTLKLMK